MEGVEDKDADALAPGAWHKLRDVPMDPSTRVVTLDDFGGANAATRFYRVVTPLQS
jgi:hypothetical protein